MPTAAAQAANFAPALNDREFDKICRLAHERFGLDLRDGKQSLVAARLGETLRELGFKSFEQYYGYVQADRTGRALAQLADRLTTNHTSFFREPRHFDFLRKVVYPDLRMRPRIDIWSAACSSGEEPYTIAMSLLEEAPDSAARVRIRATDISTRVLETAKNAFYPPERVRDIPPAMLQRYMAKEAEGGHSGYRMRPQLRAMVQLERVNLMEPLLANYRCPVIFCRNIMIYFDKPTRQDLVQRLAHQLEEGGYLFVGHSESLNGIAHGLDYVSPATYRKPGRLRGHTGGAR